MKNRSIRFIDSSVLHIIAMSMMLLDHMWGTVVQGNNWMTCLGRMAYPIFAFMIVEGYFHTHNIKRYFLRLLIGALLSEIPFNLMLGGYWIDPFDQNVIWTLLIGLCCVHLTERTKQRIKYRIAKKNKPREDDTHARIQRSKFAQYGLSACTGIIIFLAGAIIALIGLVDYLYYGVLMIGVFYAFHGTKWYHTLGKIAGMILINCFLFKGLRMDISLFGHSVEILQQGFACLALVPILLYNGEKGFGGKKFQVFCYLFYPVHILILSLAALYL